MKTEAFYVSVFFTLIALYCTLRPNQIAGAGLAAYDNGLNYQSLSYMASYGAAFAEYSLLQNNQQSTPQRVVSYSIVVINLITILLSGGRGGIVSYALFLLMTIVLYSIQSKKTASEIIRYLLIAGLLLGGLFVSVRVAENATLITSGYQRILGFFRGSGDANRLYYARASISVFKERPLFGHGIGATIYELGFYSHNFLLDLLIEVGIIGVIITLYFLWKIIVHVKNMIKKDFSDILWLYILVSGLVMLLFSGYYLASVNTWWAAFFIAGKARKLHEDKKYIENR